MALYVETEEMDEMDGDLPNMIHSLTGPLVLQGEGTRITGAFLDENSTLISIMVRDDPSPVWYEVVDSFQICGEGNWIDTIISEVIIVYWISLLSHTHTHKHTHTQTHAHKHFLMLCPEIYAYSAVTCR